MLSYDVSLHSISVNISIRKINLNQIVQSLHIEATLKTSYN